MASRIKGITVEIGGDTTKLDKALASTNKQIKTTQNELKDVERLLKIDPGNTVLLTQKQQLLANAVSQTSEKLSKLEQAQDQVTAAFQRGDLGQESYMAFQREVEETKAALNKYKNEIAALESEQDDLAKNTARLEKLFAALDGDIDDYASVIGSKLVTAIRTGTANSTQLKTAIEKIAKAATGGKADIKQLTNALDTVDDGQAVKNLIQQLNDVGDAAQDAAEDIGDIASATKGTAIMEAADQLSVVGDKIKAVGASAVTAYADTEKAVAKVVAYFGETGEAAEQSARVIQAVYEEGVGDSIESVADAVLMVKKNLGDLDDVELTNLTKQAITLEQLYGIDMNETLRGVYALMQQFGLSAQEAMDYIVVGTQNGLDKTNELGDNLSEYSGKFAQAGYSAAEYFQLLDNGLKNGAYNLDKVNDAINEVTTRLADGTIEDSIGLFSAETQGLFYAWKSGRATQKQVIDSMVHDIATTTNQQEALNMAALAFGTMAEDGNLKFISSLTTVGETYNDVGDAAENMFDQAITPMQEMEANTRKLQQSLVPLGEKIIELANTILPPLVEIIEVVSDWFSKLPEPVQNFVIILGSLIVAFTALAPVIMALGVSFGFLSGMMGPILIAILAIAAAITALIVVFGFLKEHNISLGEAILGVWGEITGVFQSFDEFLTGVFSTDWTEQFGAFGEVLNAFFDTVSKIWEGIKRIFSGIITFITGVFSGNWSQAWQGIVDIFGGIFDTLSAIALAPFNAVIGVINGILQGIADGINAVIDMINNIKIDIPDIIPGLGGKTIGFNVGSVTAPQIPYLADGAIIPPSSPFMAVLGDQASGINIETPEKLLRQVVREESTSGGGLETIVLQFTGNMAQLARIMKPELDKQTRLNGTSLVVKGGR